MTGGAGRPDIVPGGAHMGAVLAALHAAAFPPAERWDAAAMDAVLAMPGVLVGLGRLGGDPVPQGFVIGRVVADEAEILTLAVAGTARRRGLGRALLDWMEGQVAARGAGRLILEVSAANEGARALYRGAGFTEIGRRRAYYADGSDALVLERALGGEAPPAA
ncbi:GNAT family N-acetyltransferase [Gluconacetobacter takamatsuzukensis]|uniref:GNAT family N-acetyltransferase n=1 Tax=Gluconacetobacter takamatsuzukensis TaxID=1286190 RepID=A0A7W4KBP7_9PROT|nr:GNAT family N-acetyltransferase [Gluconacetobacter takamatsuzukensis]MBB2204001.1 GNAT family N-acetyltransferase [Gluconacetobacter takamatsuzukensis]